MSLKVAFHRIARSDLLNLHNYIEDRNSLQVTENYLGRIEALCMRLGDFPNRGVDRSDLGPQLRTISLEKRVTVLYRVTPDSVHVLRVLYAGRDLAADNLPH